MYIEKTNKRENRYTYEKNHDNKKCHDKLQKCIAMLCVFAMITCLCVPFGGKYIYADDAVVEVEESDSVVTQHKHKMSVDCEENVSGVMLFNEIDQEWVNNLSGASSYKDMQAGIYYLTEDIDVTSLHIGKNTTVHLCLNGHTIKGTKAASVIEISGSNSVLNLCDCQGTGEITGLGANNIYGGGIVINYGGQLNMYGGNIVDNKAQRGGGVSVGYSGDNNVFNMYGGKIANNTAISYSGNTGMGGGVHISRGEFNFFDGKIVDNVSQMGGGVYNAKTFNMYGGEISRNHSERGGGGIYQFIGVSTVVDGIISNNSDDEHGGGAFVDGGTLGLSGGKIAENEAPFAGGIILRNGKINLSKNPIIKDNIATNADSNRHNLYVVAGKLINIVGKLTSTERIGITMSKAGTFTSDWKAVMGDADEDLYFISEDNFYEVNNNGAGELWLGPDVQPTPPQEPTPPAITTNPAIHSHDMTVQCKTGNASLTFEPLSRDVVDGFTSVSGGGKYFATGNYYLTEDIDVTSLEISYNTTVNLCLNGHKITGSPQNSVIKVETNSGKLNICDCQEGGMITGGGSTGEGGTYGGGIYIQGGATFNMYGGEIAHNKALVGGGVWLDRGTFNMYGGNIHDNQVKGYTIDVSTYSPGHGGGVYIGKNGAFNLIDGELYNNSANICFEETRGGDGAAVYCYGTFIMEDGRIYNNKGFGTSSVISASNNISKVTINGGSIDNNISEKGVGGIKLFGGVLNLNGGTINNNDGYGVYAVQSTINLLGKNISIQNNKDANNVEKNMFLQDNQKLNITGLLENSDIGITMVKSQSAAISDNPGIFTVGWPSKMGDKEGKNYFSSDNPKYEVIMADDGEVMLAEAQEEVPKAITISGIHLEATDIPEKWTNLSDMRAPKEEVIIEATGTAILNDEVVYRYAPSINNFEVYATADNAEQKGVDSIGNYIDLTYNLTETGQYYIYAEGEDSVFDKKYLNIDVDKPDAPYLLEDDQTKIPNGSNIDVSTTYAAVKAPEINQYQSVSNMYYSFEGSEFKMLVDTVILTPASDGKLIMRTIDLAGNVSEDTIYNVKKKIVIVAPPEEKPSKLPSSPGKQPAKGLPYYYKSGDSGEIVFIGISQLDEYENAKYVAPKGKKIYFKYNPKYFVDTVGHWAKENIDFVTEREIFIGTHPDRFSPNKNMTRGMFATVLGRMYERSYTNIPKGAHSVFSDVDPNLYYNDYITWANQVDILRGYEDGKFYPDKDITREEMAAIMYRFAKYLGEPVTSSVTTLNYADADSIAPWFQTECLYVQNYKLMEGRGNGLLKPKATALRCEVSAVIERFVDVLLDN